MNNSPVDSVKRVAEIRQTAAWMVEKSNNKAHVESIRFVVNVQNPEKQYLVLRKVLTAYTDFGCSAPPPQRATTPSSQNHLALTPFQPGRPVKHHEHVPLCRREAREESWSQKTDCGNWTESIFIEPPTECLDRLNCLGSYKSLSADCVRSQSHPLCVISWGAGRYLSPAMLNERISLVWSEQMRFWALVGQ